MVFQKSILPVLMVSGIFMAFCPPARAEITIGDTQTVSSANNAAPAASFDVEVTTTLGCVVAVFIAFQDYNSITLNSVTLEGDPMNEGVPLFAEDDAQGAFYYLSPEQKGLNTVSITTSNASGNSNGMTVRAIVLYGVDTTAVPRTAHGRVSKDSAVTSIDLTISPLPPDSQVFAFGVTDSGSSNLDLSCPFFPIIETNLPNSAFASRKIVTDPDPAIEFSIVDTRDNLGDAAVIMVVAVAAAPPSEEPGGAVIELG